MLKPKFLKFGAEWCGPCKILDPKIEILKKEFESQVDFESIDVDENSELAKKFSVKAVPTVILVREEEELFRVVGAVNIDPLRKNLKRVLKND